MKSNVFESMHNYTTDDIIEKDYNIGQFESRKDFIVADKILQFEVLEYED